MAKKKFIIEFDADTGDFTKGVGEVKKGIEEVNAASGDMGGGFEDLQGAADGMTGGMISGFKNGLKSVKNMVKGMSALKGAILATGVGALVVALGSLVAWMKSTERGAKAMKTASIAADIAFVNLVDSAASLGGKMAEGEEETENWMQTMGGWVDSALATVGVMSTFGIVVDVATMKAKAMVEVQDELIRVTGELTVDNANLNGEIERNQKVIDDTTKSYAERKKALKAQNEDTLKLAENTRIEAELQKQSIKDRQTLAITDLQRKEIGQELAEATAAVIEAETRIAIIQLDNAQKSREIDLEEIERKKSIYNTTASLKLESIADEGERIEAEFEMRKKQLEDELTLLKASDEETLIALALLDAGKILALQDYNAQVKEEEDKVAEEKRVADEDKVTAAKNTWAALLAEGDKAVKKQEAADAAVLSSKLALTKGIGAGIGALGALMREGSAEAKAMALTEIGINTAVGFIQGLDIAQKSAKAMGPAAAFAMPIFYASQIAAVLSAAAQARNVLKSGGSGGKPSMPSTPSIGGGGSTSEPTPPSIDFGFLETGANQTAIQAYVVEQNVSDSQQANQLIQDQSAL